MKIDSRSGRGDIRKQQALRLRRLVLGAVSYLFTLALVFIYWYLGYFAMPVVLTYAAIVLALNAFFFAAIKTSVNLRLADPSMTLAIHGLFQFRLRDFVVLTLVMGGYAALIVPRKKGRNRCQVAAPGAFPTPLTSIEETT